MICASSGRPEALTKRVRPHAQIMGLAGHEFCEMLFVAAVASAMATAMSLAER